MELIRQFEQLSKNDASIAGGKGASLGEMTQAGIPVPPGFVVLSSAFERFLEEADLNQELDAILHTVNKDEMHTVENASEKIQVLIIEAEMPIDIAQQISEQFAKLGSEFVAVRSSATAEDSSSAAWAGQLDTFLNTTEETLLQNVQKCWASLFTPRAIFYRFEKGMHAQKISVAVVVQKMVQSEVSGIAFSVHPVTEDYNQMIIEAGFGLGEAIVSGQVTPDSYVIEKDPRHIIDKNISHQNKALWRATSGGNEWHELSEVEGSKPALSDKQAFELADIIMSIEKHYGFPCDIEWCFDAEQFFITQSRPITTLKSKESPASLNVRNYTLTFEGAGMTFGFEYELYTHYWPSDSLSIIIDGHVQEFVSNRVLKEMDEAGLRVTLEEIQGRVHTANVAIEKARTEMNDILARPLTKTGVRRTIELGGAITNSYYYFDPHFWDSLYEHSRLDKTAKAVVLVVEEHKNKVREYFNEFYFGDTAFFRKLLQKLAAVVNVPVADLEMYKADELSVVLDGARIPDEVVEVRRRAFVIVRSEALTVYTGKEALNFTEQFFVGKEAPSGADVIGKGAHSTGHKIQGSVRVITRDYTNFDRTLREMEAMKKGEILVTQTTDPEMMPALRKAAAAVTDIGGMLSHTAIVARELNIPCIVDTKVATQIFKNGDMVEVDAERGIVRKLESDLPSGDWFKFIERTGHFYVYALFAETDSWLLKQQVGLGFSSSLYRFQNGLGANYRNPDDYDAVNRHFLEMIKSEDPRLAPLAQKGVQYNAEADVLMAKYKDPKALSRIPPSQFRADHELLLKMFLYSCTIPYLVLDASDYGKALMMWRPEYDERVKAFEPLRGLAKYFECEELLIGHYRTLAAAATKIDPPLTVFLMPNEFVSIFVGTPTVTEEELRKRKEWCVFWSTDGGKDFTFCYDPNIANTYAFLRDPKPTGEHELSGTVAFKGKVRGRVSIVTTAEETGKCKQGDILVSQSTNPTLMQAILLCAGIVTDEGGVASHASIIARELKKPAIVGTKFATQIFKDGDMVEVDADRGIVRKI